jgi:hypothetical protein
VVAVLAQLRLAAMVALAFIVLLLTNSNTALASGTTYEVSADVHEVRFVGTLVIGEVSTDLNIPEHCGEGQFKSGHIFLVQNEMLPGQVGAIKYNLPAWSRMSTEGSSIVCVGFTNLYMEFSYADGTYTQTNDGETVANGVAKEAS